MFDLNQETEDKYIFERIISSCKWSLFRFVVICRDITTLKKIFKKTKGIFFFAITILTLILSFILISPVRFIIYKGYIIIYKYMCAYMYICVYMYVGRYYFYPVLSFNLSFKQYYSILISKTDF